VVGKTDDEPPWADDRGVLRTGEPVFRHEYVDQSGKGKATLSVCKFPEELDGTRRVMGVSFVIG